MKKFSGSNVKIWDITKPLKTLKSAKSIKNILRGIIKDEDGSSIVEAVIVLPIVILAVLCTVAISTYLCNAVFASVDMHKNMTRAAGEQTQTRILEGSPIRDYAISDGNVRGVSCKSASKTITGPAGFLLEKQMREEIEARIYVIDEKKITRYKDLLGEVLK